MPINGVQAWYFEEFPIDLLDYFDVPESRTGGVKTGGMSAEAFQELLDSIKEKGLINPVIAENDNTRTLVQLGNNRCVAMKQLGYDTIKTVYCTKNSVLPPVKGGYPISLNTSHARTSKTFADILNRKNQLNGLLIQPTPLSRFAQYH